MFWIFSNIEQNLFAYQETCQFHLNLSSIKRTQDKKKNNGHLSSISPAKGYSKCFAKLE